MMMFRGRVQSVIQNPIVQKEWRSRTYRRFSISIGLLYGVILTCPILILIFLLLLIFVERGSANLFTDMPWPYLGAFFCLFSTFVEGLFLTLITPALTVGAISREREYQTYDILRTTTLSARRLISGKLLSALRYPLLIITVSTAFQLFAVFTPAIRLVDVVIIQLMMVMTALTTALLGLSASTIFHSTLGSTVFAYATLCFLLIGIPFMMIGMGIMAQVRSFGTVPQRTIMHANHLVGSINLPYTVSQTIKIRGDSQSYWGETRRVARWGPDFEAWFPSPWYLYLFWQGVLSLGLYKLAVWQVGRIPD